MVRILALGAVVIVVIAAAIFVVRWARSADHGDEEEAPVGRDRTPARSRSDEGGDNNSSSNDWSADDYRSPQPIRGKYAAPSPGVRPGGSRGQGGYRRDAQSGGYGAQDGYGQQPAGRGGHAAGSHSSGGYSSGGYSAAPTAGYPAGGYEGAQQGGYQDDRTQVGGYGADRGYESASGSYRGESVGYGGTNGYPAANGYPGANDHPASSGYGDSGGRGAGSGYGSGGYANGSGSGSTGGYPTGSGSTGGYSYGSENGYGGDTGHAGGNGYGPQGGYGAQSPAGNGNGRGAPARQAIESGKQDEGGKKKGGRRFGLRRHDDDEIWPDDGVSDEDYWASVATERSLPSTGGPAEQPALPAGRGSAGRLSADPRQAQRPGGVPSTGSVRFGSDDPRGRRTADAYGDQPRGPYPHPYGEQQQGRDDHYGRGRR